jgi:hypothetical protein
MAAVGRVGSAALGALLVGRPDAGRFICRVEEIIDETCPQFEDRFLCVRMLGRIPTAQENTDTDVCVELLDITDGPARAEQVLSVDPQWRRDESPVFHNQTHNGVIPFKDAVLANEVEIARIPFHLLRFARRGRRKIQVSVGVLARPDGACIVCADACIEYVARCEGFIEIQERREAVLRACVELACAVVDKPAPSSVAEIISAWIGDKTRRFTPRSDLAEPLNRLVAAHNPPDADAACECLLASGQKADRVAAIDLALQAAACSPALSYRQEELLWTLARRFEIPPDRFLTLCQKRLLTETCSFERWRLLLGICEDLSSEALRLRLNEEYRKWNARVTNPDAIIRRQADIILTLIADVRSRQLCTV